MSVSIPTDDDDEYLPDDEEVFYRGGTATATLEPGQGRELLRPHEAFTEFSGRSGVLVGLSLSIVAAVLLAVSLWTLVEETMAALTIAGIGGGGMLAVSLVSLYLGLALGGLQDGVIDLSSR